MTSSVYNRSLYINVTYVLIYQILSNKATSGGFWILINWASPLWPDLKIPKGNQSIYENLMYVHKTWAGGVGFKSFWKNCHHKHSKYVKYMMHAYIHIYIYYVCIEIGDLLHIELKRRHVSSYPIIVASRMPHKKGTALSYNTNLNLSDAQFVFFWREGWDSPLVALG